MIKPWYSREHVNTVKQCHFVITDVEDEIGESDETHDSKTDDNVDILA